MNNEFEQDDSQMPENEKGHGLKDRITGFGQKIIGEIESIGGVLTGDPLTNAEGEFNVEVGDLREEIEEDLEEGGTPERKKDVPHDEDFV